MNTALGRGTNLDGAPNLRQDGGGDRRSKAPACQRADQPYRNFKALVGKAGIAVNVGLPERRALLPASMKSAERTFYLVAMRRGEWPNQWIWEIFHRGEPLTVRIWGGYFKSEAKALDAIRGQALIGRNKERSAAAENDPRNDPALALRGEHEASPDWWRDMLEHAAARKPRRDGEVSGRPGPRGKR
jgi:hypothetical protein